MTATHQDYSDSSDLGLLDVRRAYKRIKQHIVETPVLLSPSLSTLANESRTILQRHGGLQSGVDRSAGQGKTDSDGSTKGQGRRPEVDLFFKCENFQKTGSFKYRGALNSIINLPDEVLRRGLRTTSSGNHAKALIIAARDLSRERGVSAIPVHVVMPSNASRFKIRTVKSLGGIVHISGPSWAERGNALSVVGNKTGATLISLDRDPSILLGQGTVGLELLSQFDRVHGGAPDAVIAPCGTGSLLAGLALTLRGTNTALFGAEPAMGGADDARRGRAQGGQRITHVESSSMADGLRCPVSEMAWPIIRRQDLVEDVFAVSENGIREGVRWLVDERKIMVESNAAVGLAAVMDCEGFWKWAEQRAKECEFREGCKRKLRVAVVLTGGNISVKGLQETLGWAAEYSL